MASLVGLQQQTQPSFSFLTSSLSDFNGTRLHSHIQYKRKVWQPKGGLQVTASSEKKILIMGGTRFIGVFLSRLLVKEGHQVTLFTRGKAPITQQLPGESDQDYADFSSKILHLKGDRMDFDFVKSSLSAKGFDVVYDINGREADEVEPILDALPKLEQYIYCSSAGVYLKSDLLPHCEVDAVDPKSRHKGKLNTEALLESRDVNYTSMRPVYIYGPLNYNPVEEWFFHRLKAGRPIPIPNSGVQITQLGHVKASWCATTKALIIQQFPSEADQDYADFSSKTKAFAVPRRNAIAMILSSYIFSKFGSSATAAFAQQSVGFREYIDTFDGYSFKYPQNWIQVRGAGADIFFRDPFVLDENVSVDVSSPSSSRYKSVEDLGPPQEAGKKVLKQYLTEFMSTRLGVKRESSVLSTSSRVADDGRIYYLVEVNIKSFANNNELAVMPEDRVVSLEWDRRYLSVLGVENNRLYALRLQTPENVFAEEESDLRAVIDSFRVNKVSA